MTHRPIRPLPALLLSGLLAPVLALAATPVAAGAGPGTTSSPTVVATGEDDPAPFPRGEREPADTQLRQVDGTNVVTQYGHVVPSFDGWARREPTRDYLDLSGQWAFRFDPDGIGTREGWQRPRVSDQGWDRIAVPSSWDLKDTPGFGGYDGSRFGEGTAFQDGFAWYRTTVRVPRDWRGQFVRLSFLAVNYRADVWVDGRFVGAHEGGHTPFALPLDEVRPGRLTTLAVRVHRRASFPHYASNQDPVTDPLAVPYKPVDYWPYAGITRQTWLEAVPRTSVAKVLTVAGEGRFEARVVVENNGPGPWRGRVAVDAGVPGAPVVRVPLRVGAGDVAVAVARQDVPGARTWTPSSPRTYRASATLADARGRAVDTLSTRYGYRTVEVADAQLRVNDEQVFLKGLNWHEETATGGRTMSLDDYDRELGHVLDTGATMIRNSVYNRHPYVYDWADEHGVFVMDDLDNMWLNTDQERLQTQSYGLSRSLATTMAWNQHNNPSVIVWSLQNESEIDPGGGAVYRAWLADMKEAVKAVDLTDRPVTWASSTTDDPAFDLADVIGFNEYFGYFYGEDDDLGPAIDAVHQRYPGKPIVITENGTWAVPGTHGPADEEGTEEWQAASFRSHWQQTTERSDYVAGYTSWVLKDYKQRLGYNQAYNGISVMGLLGFDGTTRKLVYDAFADAQVPSP